MQLFVWRWRDSFSSRQHLQLNIFVTTQRVCNKGFGAKSLG